MAERGGTGDGGKRPYLVLYSFACAWCMDVCVFFVSADHTSLCDVCLRSLVLCVFFSGVLQLLRLNVLQWSLLVVASKVWPCEALFS